MDDVSLDRNKEGHRQKKETCPSCTKRHRFVRYFNFTAGEYLPIEFGRCDREQECGYHNEPWEWLKGNQSDSSRKPAKQASQPKPKVEYKYVSKDVLKKTLAAYESNVFVAWLADVVGNDKAITDAISKYLVGTAKNGGTIFWQINRYMQVCTGQLIYYGADGHRRKDIFPAARRLFENKDGYTTCLYGEHLLFDMKPNDLVGLVESEKTAFICSIYKPVMYGRRIHWLATCGVNGLTDEKAFALKGKDVVLCPDFSYHARAVWGLVPMRRKRDGKRVFVSEDGELVGDYISARSKLERIGCKVTYIDHPEVNDGSDIADLLVLSKPAASVAPPPALDLNIKPKSALESARDSSWSDILSAADKMLVDRYGKDGLNPVDYKERKIKLQQQLDLSVDPRVQALAKAFDCEFDFDY